MLLPQVHCSGYFVKCHCGEQPHPQYVPVSIRQTILVANTKTKKMEPRDQLCILDSMHQFVSEKWNGAASRSLNSHSPQKSSQHNMYSRYEDRKKRRN